MSQQPPNGHPWKFAWKRGATESAESAESTAAATPIPESPNRPPESDPAAWLAAHAADLLDCPLGPLGIRILPAACAARQRAAKIHCRCVDPPVSSADREGSLAGDADHYQLKARRGSLAQKYGRHAADQFSEADAPAELKGTAGTTRRKATKRPENGESAGGAEFVPDREAETWQRREEDRELIRDIMSGRIWA